jgi:AmmeMemoRadiSam system protein B
MKSMDPIDTRPAALAGTWYSANPQQLRSEVADYIQSASVPEFSGEIVALIAPHAGHRYSGPVAGYAFRAIQGNRYETVAVVSPYHHPHAQALLTSAHDSYETPLGRIPIDKQNQQALNEWLQKSGAEMLQPIRRDNEHAIEIELPFLQAALDSPFQLLPVMIADASPQTAYTLGSALAATLKDQRTLLVASTDLSHFYPEQKANQLDQAMLNAIASFEPNEVVHVHQSGEGQACGLLPVLAVMTAARTLGATRAHIFHYATSGATSGDYSRVVGYGAGAFTRPLESKL